MSHCILLAGMGRVLDAASIGFVGIAALALSALWIVSLLWRWWTFRTLYYYETHVFFALWVLVILACLAIWHEGKRIDREAMEQSAGIPQRRSD